MQIIERTAGGVDALRRVPAAEKNALRRDRYRAVLLAIQGQEAAQVAAALGWARRSVQHWAYAYRDGGIGAIQPERRTDRRAKLAAGDEGSLRGRLDTGRPRPTACAPSAAATWSAFFGASSA